MKYTGDIKFPNWVNPKKLLIGDVSYRERDDSPEWRKMLYNGTSWIPFNLAIPQLQQKSGLRQRAMEHNQLTRKTGRY